MCNSCGTTCGTNCGCNANTCENDLDFIVSITRDANDEKLLRSLSYQGEIEEWYEGQIRSISIQSGRILVDVFQGNNVVIDGADLDFQYLKSIKLNDNGSIDVLDSKGLLTKIPAGFPRKVIYGGDQSFTLATDDGQSITVDVLEALGSYVKCVSYNCDGDLVFEVIGNGDCSSCETGTITIPMGSNVEEDPIYMGDKPLIALNSSEDSIAKIITLNNGDGSTLEVYNTEYIDDLESFINGEIANINNAIAAINGNISDLNLIISNLQDQVDGLVISGIGFDDFSYDNTTKTLSLTIGGVTKDVDLTPLSDELQSQIDTIISGGYVEDVVYDSTLNTLTFTKSDGSTVEVPLPGAIDLSDYWTSVETQTAITAAIDALKAGGLVKDITDAPDKVIVTFIDDSTLDIMKTVVDLSGLEKDHTLNPIAGTVTLTNSLDETIDVYTKTKMDSLLADIDTAIGDLQSQITSLDNDLTSLQTTVNNLIASGYVKTIEDDTINDKIIVTFSDDTTLEIPKGGGTVDFSGLEKDHVVNGDTITLTTSADETVDTFTKTAIQTLIAELQTQFNAIIIEAVGGGTPVALSATAVKILEFAPIVVDGKYDGAMRATWTGTGLREVTLEVRVNNVALVPPRTDVGDVTDEQTVGVSTALPLDLVAGDVVSVWASSPTGSVGDIQGVLKLILSNGSVDLSGLQKDFTLTPFSSPGNMVVLTNSDGSTARLYDEQHLGYLIGRKFASVVDPDIVSDYLTLQSALDYPGFYEVQDYDLDGTMINGVLMVFPYTTETPLYSGLIVSRSDGLLYTVDGTQTVRLVGGSVSTTSDSISWEELEALVPEEYNLSGKSFDYIFGVLVKVAKDNGYTRVAGKPTLLLMIPFVTLMATYQMNVSGLMEVVYEFVPGLGTPSDPYNIAGSILTFTDVSGKDATADSNSTMKYEFRVLLYSLIKNIENFEVAGISSADDLTGGEYIQYHTPKVLETFPSATGTFTGSYVSPAISVPGGGWMDVKVKGKATFNNKGTQPVEIKITFGSDAASIFPGDTYMTVPQGISTQIFETFEPISGSGALTFGSTWYMMVDGTPIAPEGETPAALDMEVTASEFIVEKILY